MRNSKSLVLYVLLAVGICFGLNALLIYFESQVEGSSLTTFQTAFWYLVVTITTVGYGDHFPVSNGGRIIGYLYVFSSLGVLGFLFSTISSKIYTMLEEAKLGFKGTQFEEHIVFLGWSDFNRQVANDIVHAGKKLAILTEKKDDVDLIYDQYGKQNVFVLFSDRQNEEIFQRLNVPKASVVFIAQKDDTAALMDVVNLKAKFPDISIVVSLFEPKLKQTFMSAGVTYVVSKNEIASKLVASYIFEPDVAKLNVELISSAGTDSEFDVQEYEVLDENPYLGMNGKDIFHKLKEDYDAVLMGISKPDGKSWRLVPNPSHEVTLNKGDFLVLMTNGYGKSALEKAFDVSEGRVMKYKSDH